MCGDREAKDICFFFFAIACIPGLSVNRPVRLTQCCTQFKSLGVKVLCVFYLHDNVAFTFKWYGNAWNKMFYSQRIWIGYNIELAESLYCDLFLPFISFPLPIKLWCVCFVSPGGDSGFPLQSERVSSEVRGKFVSPKKSSVGWWRGIRSMINDTKCPLMLSINCSVICPSLPFFKNYYYYLLLFIITIIIITNITNIMMTIITMKGYCHCSFVSFWT